MMSAPAFTTQGDLEEAVTTIEKEEFNLVIFLWPASVVRPTPFSPYYPITFSLIPRIPPSFHSKHITTFLQLIVRSAQNTTCIPCDSPRRRRRG